MRSWGANEDLKMDTVAAFAINVASQGKELKVFDWDKAATLIAEKKPAIAGAGLAGDWEWTGGSIFRNGAPIPREETYTYLSSSWATPELEIDGLIVSCFKMESETPGWDCDTYWPESALAILRGEKV